MMNSYEKAIWCINNRKDLWKPEQMLELFNKILDHPEWFAEGFCSRKNLIKIVGTRWLIWLATGNTLRDIKILEVNSNRSYSLNELYNQCRQDRNVIQ
uniref:Uncharacterized protein n=1 Tax=viral metagenome TaxID=1070528 RepID=A0A6H2A1M8_9ZZZZ